MKRTSNRPATLTADIDRAIQNHLVIEAPYKGGMRLLEPHYRALDQKGEQCAVACQIAGHSIGALPKWQSLHLSELGDLRVLRTNFSVRPHNKAELFAEFRLSDVLCSVDSGSNRFLDREI